LLVQPGDDDGSDIYEGFLRDHGLTPLAVSNARDALAVAPKADVIVTGVLLPGSTDGIELIAQLRRNEPTRHTPIIVLTVCAWQTERKRCRDAGCDVFLPKPCPPDTLLREVRRLLAASDLTPLTRTA
jgi:CheY-like chemotaxis protein